MELFLAQLLGMYFIIMGAIVSIQRTSVMPAVADLARNRGLVFLIGVIELVAGLALILVYPTVDFSVPGIIALVGWMMVIESIIYLALPARATQKFIGRFNRPVWYIFGGLLSIAAGVYLAGTGFGFFAL